MTGVNVGSRLKLSRKTQIRPAFPRGELKKQTVFAPFTGRKNNLRNTKNCPQQFGTAF